MSDARWLDVDEDVAAAARHFTNALALHARGRFDDPGIDGYRDAMALMHSMQAGHTSAETALLRVMRMLGEDPPTGEDWHRTLVARLARANCTAYARPALLSQDVARDLDETRRFRHIATRAYDGFDATLAEPALAAGRRLAVALPSDIARFKALVDPG